MVFSHLPSGFWRSSVLEMQVAAVAQRAWVSLLCLSDNPVQPRYHWGTWETAKRKFRPVIVSATTRFLGAVQGKRVSRVCHGAWNQPPHQLPSDLATIFILILHKQWVFFSGQADLWQPNRNNAALQGMRLDWNKRIHDLHCFISEWEHIKQALCPSQQSSPDAYCLSHSPPSGYHSFCGHCDLKLPLCSGKVQPIIGLWRACPLSAWDGLRPFLQPPCLMAASLTEGASSCLAATCSPWHVPSCSQTCLCRKALQSF